VAPVAQRLVEALEPTLERAQALSRSQGGAVVNNVFNVSVALQGSSNAPLPDAPELEQALTDWLLAAARRHGLEL
jgi:hypothetical protein